MSPPPTEGEESQTADLSAGTPSTLEYTGDVAVDSITITSSSDATEVVVTVDRNPSPPSGVGAAPDNPYAYLVVEVTNLEAENIDSAEMTFKVEKSWLAANNLDPASVTLNVYSNGQWTAIDTSQASSDGTYYYFTSSIAGPGTYSITAAALQAPEQPAQPTQPAQPSYPTIYYIIALVVIILAAAALAVYSHSRKKKKPSLFR